MDHRPKGDISLTEHICLDAGGQRIVYVRASGPNGKLGEVTVKVDRPHSEAEIDGLLVGRDFRGFGLGTKLLNHAERVARRYGVGRIALRPVPIDGSDLKDLRSWYLERGYVRQNGFMVKKPGLGS